ncbi:MAG: hypothetical protein O3A47_05465 [Chloroflexi bacterium]|nr:hypothetical protein [Chloroflexota bacterium]
MPPQPKHKHEQTIHTQEHNHVTHVVGEGGKLDHRISTHSHEHNHSAVEHAHAAHVNAQKEHETEGHIHDHARPTTG